VNNSRWPISVIYAVLLAACAYFAWQQLFGLMFGMGESGAALGFVGAAFLIVTAFGVLGFAIAAFGVFSRVRAFGVLGLASAIAVLPVAGIFAWQEFHFVTSIAESSDPLIRSMYQHHTWDLVKSFLPLALDLAAICLSWLWLRMVTRTGSSQNIPPRLA
jgi:hypothetical protein